MNTSLNIFLLTNMLFLSSCFFDVNTTLRGDGNLVTENIDIENYSSIEFVGKATIKYTQSDSTAGLTVTTDKNIYDIYEFLSDDGRLIIKPKGNSKRNIPSPTEFSISTSSAYLENVNMAGNVIFNMNGEIKSKELRLNMAGKSLINIKDSLLATDMNINLAGMGKVNAPRINITNISVNIAGKGNINLKGNSENASFKISGKGNVECSELKANTVKVKLAGRGDLYIYPIKELDIQSAGLGYIHYRGKPEVMKRKTVGIGYVRQIEE